MLEYFRQLIALRHAHSALRHGAFQQLYADQQQYAFLRRDSSETLVVVLNAAEDPARIELPIDGILADGHVVKPLFGMTSEFRAQNRCLPLTIPPRAGCVLSG